MLRMYEGKLVISKKEIRFVTALDLTKFLKQLKINRDCSTCAPISELPYNISTMLKMKLVHNETILGQILLS